MDNSDQHAEKTNDNNKSPGRNILFGKYEMGRLLGQGTFAKVYHGKNLATSESVAIKVINKKEVMRDSLIMEQIKREISIMRLVRHPNVVELKEVMATKGKIFFVMEYVKGGELFAKVLRGKLKEDTARKYFQQLISAIDFCHSRGVYHRDLKPENLLLDESGDLKVSDFGLSALPEQLRNDGMLHTQCGTPAYVAPEVLRKKGYSGAKADIWSCGVVLFVLLAGYLPFQDENVVKMYRKVFKADYEFPRWFSEGSKSLVSKLLVVDPEKRLSIAEIMRHRWFRTGLVERPVVIDDNKVSLAPLSSSSPPPFYNAFELISSLSSGFDLSGLFEGKRRRSTGSMFTSKCSASGIMARLEALARKANFGFAVEKEFKATMRGRAEGRRGRLAVVAEVFEAAPNVAVVELSKSSGDTLEYVRFCRDDVRPALSDIVWTWQGDETTANDNNDSQP